jgi:hypothetical protein
VLAWSGVLGVLTWTGMELLSSYTIDSKKILGLVTGLTRIFFPGEKGKNQRIGRTLLAEFSLLCFLTATGNSLRWITRHQDSDDTKLKNNQGARGKK